MLEASSVTSTLPTPVETVSPFAFVMLPLTAPVKAEPSVRFSVSAESSPTRISPESVCAFAFRVAVLLPPLQPTAHTESSTFELSVFVMATPESVITAPVLVTWNTWPLLLKRLPPVIVKEEVPPAASPDMD